MQARSTHYIRVDANESESAGIRLLSVPQSLYGEMVESYSIDSPRAACVLAAFIVRRLRI